MRLWSLSRLLMLQLQLRCHVPDRGTNTKEASLIPAKEASLKCSRLPCLLQGESNETLLPALQGTMAKINSLGCQALASSPVDSLSQYQGALRCPLKS